MRGKVAEQEDREGKREGRNICLKRQRMRQRMKGIHRSEKQNEGERERLKEGLGNEHLFCIFGTSEQSATQTLLSSSHKQHHSE